MIKMVNLTLPKYSTKVFLVSIVMLSILLCAGFNSSFYFLSLDRVSKALITTIIKGVQKEYVISEKDARNLKDIFDGKRAPFGNEYENACGFGEDVFLTFYDENNKNALTLFPAEDGCGGYLLYDEGRTRIFYLNDTQNHQVSILLQKYVTLDGFSLLSSE